MTRAPTPVEIEKRKAFSASDRRAIMLRHADRDMVARCALCNGALATLNLDGVWAPMQKLELDHVTPLSMGGKHSVENAQALCVPCHKTKSRTGEADLHKAIRMAGGEGSQYARRKAARARGEHPQIKSRGFRNG